MNARPIRSEFTAHAALRDTPTQSPAERALRASLARHRESQARRTRAAQRRGRAFVARFAAASLVIAAASLAVLIQ